MYYTRLRVVCHPDFSEILMAEIAEAGFDTFMETEEGFEAYTEEKKAKLSDVESIREKYKHVNPLLFYQDKIKKQNWNAEWEKNVEPVIVGKECLIRAEFHKVPGKFAYEIIITPKMSFGTGHHQTTHLMVQAQLKIDHREKLVMDAGCGTAILSVLASKRGAKKVEAFDIDEWSIVNGKENVERNGCGNVRIRQGTISDFTWNKPFDIILANINKNVLLEEMKRYAKNLKPGGLLLLSGFFESDIPDITGEAARHGLKIESEAERERWASALFALRP